MLFPRTLGGREREGEGEGERERKTCNSGVQTMSVLVPQIRGGGNDDGDDGERDGDGA